MLFGSGIRVRFSPVMLTVMFAGEVEVKLKWSSSTSLKYTERLNDMFVSESHVWLAMVVVVWRVSWIVIVVFAAVPFVVLSPRVTWAVQFCPFDVFPATTVETRVRLVSSIVRLNWVRSCHSTVLLNHLMWAVMISPSESVALIHKVRFSFVLLFAEVLEVFKTMAFVVGAEFTGRMISEKFCGVVLRVPSPTMISAVQLSWTVVFAEMIVETSSCTLSVTVTVRFVRLLFSVEFVNHLMYVVIVSESLSDVVTQRVRLVDERLEFPPEVLKTTSSRVGLVSLINIDRFKIEEFRISSPTIMAAVQFCPLVVFG